jgi:DNA-nicking Smr family endonuclease
MNPIKEDLDLHGLTVDEAIPRLDAFLHEAFQAGLYRVWVIWSELE